VSVQLSATGLRKCYRGLPAVEALSLELEAGTILGLLGPDGAGKTTTMRLLTGLIRPDGGQVFLDSRDVTGQRASSGRIGYMPQRFSLYPDLTVEENLLFYARLFGVRRIERRERMTRLLDFARLEPFRRRRAGALSGGMKQKLALSCTLIHAPDVLLLDEPTTGVDPISRVELWDTLHQLQADGVALLVSTPYMDEADRCDEVMIMREGRVLTRGTPARLRRSFDAALFEVAVEPLGEAARLLESIDWIGEVVPFGTSLHVTLDDPQRDAAALRTLLEEAGLEVDRVDPAEPSLEDVFVALAREGVQA